MEKQLETRRGAAHDLPLGWLVAGASFCALVIALVLASQILFSMMDHGHDWWRIFLWQLGVWLFWAAAAGWVLRIGARLLRPRQRPALWPLRLGAAALTLALAHVLWATLVFWTLQPYVPVADDSILDSFSRAARTWPQADLLIFGILTAVGYGLAGYRQARAAELRESRLATQLARAQLDALRLKIQPHFLFNTLNSVAALIRKDARDEALEMLVGLSELLRTTLEQGDRHLTPLGDEIAFVRRYVDLQRTRFADRLSVEYDIDPASLESQVPPLLLQPLVENAIRHGIGRRPEAGRIEIAAARVNGRLQLSVADDGPGLPAGFELAGAGGIGLENTRARLEQVYEGAASLELRGREGGGTVALITLPAGDAGAGTIA